MTCVPGALLEAARENKLLVFVGAGVSMNAGLPSFSQLVNTMAQLLGFDERVFRAYSNDPRVLAEFLKLKMGGLGELRSRLDKEWIVEKEQLRKSNVHKLLTQIGASQFYTTNYDTLLEDAHELYGVDFHVVKSAADLPLPASVTRAIIKFHGDFSRDESIVLTEESYFKRLDFESPFDLLLRSHLLNRVVLFIGYSLEDVNVRYMLWRMREVWKKNASDLSHPEIFFYTTSGNLIRDEVLKSRGITVLTADRLLNTDNDDHSVALEQFLEILVNGL